MDFNVIDYIELFCGSMRVIYKGTKFLYNYRIEIKNTNKAFSENIESMIEKDKKKQSFNKESISKLLEDD